jgi:RNA 2',3'-cyclic 3'-phosphodiesterase
MLDRPPAYRTFIAIEIPAEIRRQVIQHIQQLRETVPDARASWNREDNLHLTLKFLGNTAVENIAKVSQAVGVAADRVRPFDLILSGCGAFPARGKPNVLWIGIQDPSSNLTALYDEIEEECAAIGFEKEARAFHPHLTIARLRNSHSGSRLAEAHQHIPFNPQTFIVSKVTVFRSELLKQGSRHTALSHHAVRSS